MRRVVSYGYNRPNASLITCDSLTVRIGTDVLGKDETPAWDYNMNVSASCDISVELTSLLDSCGLSSVDILGASIFWSASGTSLRGSSESVVVVDGLNSIKVDIDGHQLGGKLILRPTIFLLERVSQILADASPHRPASLLWSVSESIQLEGGGSRFPTVVVSFDEVGLLCGSSAAWYLDVADVEPSTASAAGSILLYLNADHVKIINMLANPRADSSLLLASALNYDVIRQLARRALELEALSGDGDYAEGTFAYFLLDVLKFAFPAMTVQEVVSAAGRNPGEFDARIQDAVRIFN